MAPGGRGGGKVRAQYGQFRKKILIPAMKRAWRELNTRGTIISDTLLVNGTLYQEHNSSSQAWFLRYALLFKTEDAKAERHVTVEPSRIDRTAPRLLQRPT